MKTYENFHFSRYEIDSVVIYVFAQAVHYLHTALIIWLFLGVIYTLNVFYIEIVIFCSKKIGHIAKQIELMNVSKTKLVDNRKLSRLIVEYNRVLFELTQMNNFFKNYIGTSFFHFFLFCVLLSSVVLLGIDIR